MQGKVKIELTHNDTGEVEIIEGHNALTPLYKTLCENGVVPYNNDTNVSSTDTGKNCHPLIAHTIFSGIKLFSGEQDENLIFSKNGNADIVASVSSIDSDVAGLPYNGTYNSTESVYNKDSRTMVYEFSSLQAIGKDDTPRTIKSICLCPRCSIFTGEHSQSTISTAALTQGTNYGINFLTNTVTYYKNAEIIKNKDDNYSNARTGGLLLKDYDEDYRYVICNFTYDSFSVEKTSLNKTKHFFFNKDKVLNTKKYFFPLDEVYTGGVLINFPISNKEFIVITGFSQSFANGSYSGEAANSWYIPTAYTYSEDNTKKVFRIYKCSFNENTVELIQTIELESKGLVQYCEYDYKNKEMYVFEEEEKVLYPSLSNNKVTGNGRGVSYYTQTTFYKNFVKLPTNEKIILNSDLPISLYKHVFPTSFLKINEELGLLYAYGNTSSNNIYFDSNFPHYNIQDTMRISCLINLKEKKVVDYTIANYCYQTNQNSSNSLNSYPYYFSKDAQIPTNFTNASFRTYINGKINKGLPTFMESYGALSSAFYNLAASNPKIPVTYLISTVYNLETPITKTKNDTLKIYYTLQPDES